MRQLFLLILLFVVGQWFVKSLRGGQSRSGSQGQRTPGAQGAQGGQGAQSARNGQGARRPNGQPALAEPMVRCAECGVHAPRSESVMMGSQSFCSDEHARAYAARTASQDRAAR
ncbi:PP0621 family protein [Paraburkholderia sp.]|uniref:PP0621 family protein n=1 Tax=Paraburkholderia sp. TaxID=1926495 RepID=UPI0025D1B18E|nr:PP0621 family protein [Paraburkholderia sp.]